MPFSHTSRRNRLEAIERRTKEIALLELRKQIEEEELKVRQLEGWVNAWSRTREMRQFIAELEKLWAREGHNLSSETPMGQRITWMRQQADRLDPLMSEKPVSILDRKPRTRSALVSNFSG